MFAIIPVAGLSKRLRPYTNYIPKCLLIVGNKPILFHILDKIADFGIKKIILIIGYLGDMIKKEIKKRYSFPGDIYYVEQKEPLGLGHAIWLAKDIVKEKPIFIVYGDTVFDCSFSLENDCDGYIGVKEVADPTKYGICELSDGFISKVVEKPKIASSNLAIVGVNFIYNSKMLFFMLDKLISENKRTHNEIQLTDAFQKMIENEAKLKPFFIDYWFDCGTPFSIIEANKNLLKNEVNGIVKNSVIIKPVYIHHQSEINNSIIGDNVSIDIGAKINRCIISNSIINMNSVVENRIIENEIIVKEDICKE